MADVDTDETTWRILRAMAWQRAKGELHALLQTYVNSGDSGDSGDKFEKMDAAVEAFTKQVEDEGWAE